MSAVVSAMKSKLATSKDYDRIIQSSSASEILEYLRARHHQSLTVTNEGQAFRQSIEQDYWATVRRICSLSPPALRKLIRVLAEKEELSSLSHLLEGISIGLSPSVLVSNTSSYGKFNKETIRKLAELKPIGRAVEALEDTELSNAILSGLAMFGTHAELGIDLSVRTVYARRVRRAMISLVGQSESPSLRSLLGQWFELQNLLLLVRSKNLRMDAKIVKSLLTHPHFRLRTDEVDSLLNAGSLAGLLDNLARTAYGRVLSFMPAVMANATVSSFETGLDRYFAKVCTGCFYGWRFTPSLPVGFLFLKQYETQDLRTILTGKLNGLSAELIRSDLILNQTQTLT